MKIPRNLTSSTLLVSCNVLISCLILFIVRNFITLSLLLFEEILMSVTIATLMIAAGFVISRGKLLSMFSFEALVYVVVLGLLASLILLPNAVLNVDRSRSFYVLSWVEKKEIFVIHNTFIVTAKSHEAIDKSGVEIRVKEQIQRGLISRDRDNFELTKKGKFTLWLANLIGDIFKLENWTFNKY